MVSHGQLSMTVTLQRLLVTINMTCTHLYSGTYTFNKNEVQKIVTVSVFQTDKIVILSLNIKGVRF